MSFRSSFVRVLKYSGACGVGIVTGVAFHQQGLFKLSVTSKSKAMSKTIVGVMTVCMLLFNKIYYQYITSLYPTIVNENLKNLDRKKGTFG